MDDWVSESGMAVLGPARVKALSTRSDVRGAVQLASHVAAMAATAVGLAATWGTWWAVPIFILHGYLINCLFATQHECNHWTAFRTRWVNDVVNRVTGFVLLYPARGNAGCTSRITAIPRTGRRIPSCSCARATGSPTICSCSRASDTGTDGPA